MRLTLNTLCAALIVALVPGSAAAKPAPDPEPGRYIVVYDRDVTSVDRETDARERRGGFRSRLRFRRAIEGFAASLTAGQVRALRADPEVKAVVPDRPVQALAAQPYASGEPNAPNGVRRIGAATPLTASPAWVREAATTGVAVIDTGIDLDHPDLNVADGIDCVSPGTPADDDNSHGTHVAGTIGAENDGAGVTGVAPGTRVHAVKVLNATGDGLTSQIVCGIDWVIANASARGIRVINMSLGGAGTNDRNCGRTPGDEDPMHDAVCRATEAGILTVVAAGNAGWDFTVDPPDVPASYPEVLTVTAMSDGDGVPGALTKPACRSDSNDDAPAPFSNFTTPGGADESHTIAAPGVCVRSTVPGGGHGTKSGTSMASPHAAAAAALCVGEAGAAGPCAGLTPAQMIQRLRSDAAAQPPSFAGEPGSGTRYYGHLLRPVLNAPQTAFTAGAADTTDDSTPTFSFTSPTPGTRFECSLDDGGFAACESPYTTPELADGQHTVRVRAVDVTGNRDASPAADTFTVDAVPEPPPPPPPPAQDPQPQEPQPGPEPQPQPQPEGRVEAADTAAPLVSARAAGRQRIATVSRNGLRVAVDCSEACRIDARVVLASAVAKRLGLSRRAVTAGRTVRGAATGDRVVTIRLTSSVRRRLARARSVLIQVRVTVTDAAGNARTVTRAVRLVR